MIRRNHVSLGDALLSLARLKRQQRNKKESLCWIQKQLCNRKLSSRKFAVAISKLQFQFNLTTEAFNTVRQIYREGCAGTYSSLHLPVIPLNAHAIRQDILAIILLSAFALSHKNFTIIRSHAYSKQNGIIENTIDPTSWPARWICLIHALHVKTIRLMNCGTFSFRNDLMYYQKWIAEARVIISFLM